MMKKLQKFSFLLFCFILSIFACKNASKEQNYSGKPSAQKETKYENNKEEQSGRVPKKVLEVLRYVRENGEAMPGYVGGRTFQNREKVLSVTDESGRKIRYQEWDVNPKERGQNRGAERLVTSKTKAYYTNNHYKTFMEIKE